MAVLELDKGGLLCLSLPSSLTPPLPCAIIQSTDTLGSIGHSDTAWRMKHVLSRYTMINKAPQATAFYCCRAEGGEMMKKKKKMEQNHKGKQGYRKRGKLSIKCRCNAASSAKWSIRRREHNEQY